MSSSVKSKPTNESHAGILDRADELQAKLKPIEAVRL